MKVEFSIVIVIAVVVSMSMIAIPCRASPNGFIAISAGSDHALALTNYGDVWSWGVNNFGQLGIGTNGSNDVQTTPVQVQISDVIAISSGTSHSLALKNDGTVWAWGDNYHGMIGDGTTENKLLPVQIEGLKNVTAIAAGNMVSYALKDDGTLWAWGFNDCGWLGDGTTDDKLIPVQVNGVINVKTIGEHGIFAIEKDGSVWAWGDNSLAELGNGSILYGKLGDTVPEIRTTPFRIDSLSEIKSISQGNTHTIILLNNGDVYTWGLDSDGQLGTGNISTTYDKSSIVTTPRQVSIINAIAVSAGLYHSMALKSDGTVWVWGKKNGGNIIGVGNPGVYGMPTKLDGLDNIIAISAGDDYCMALKSDGSVWTWGSNQYGQLGDGKSGVVEPYRTSPMRILEGSISIQSATPITVPANGTISGDIPSTIPSINTLPATTNNTQINISSMPSVDGFGFSMAGLAGFISVICLAIYRWARKSS